MNTAPPHPPAPAADRPLPGARTALGLLLAINLFNYLDRQVLAAVVPQLKVSLFQSGQAHGMEGVLAWCQSHLGFKPENALIGLLSMAFMVCYMVAPPCLAGWRPGFPAGSSSAWRSWLGVWPAAPPAWR